MIHLESTITGLVATVGQVNRGIVPLVDVADSEPYQVEVCDADGNVVESWATCELYSLIVELYVLYGIDKVVSWDGKFPPSGKFSALAHS